MFYTHIFETVDSNYVNGKKILVTFTTIIFLRIKETTDDYVFVFIR